MISKNLLRNNVAIALNIFYPETEEIYHAYVSKCNSNSEKQVICLMIPNGKVWYYLAVKTISIIKRKNFKISWLFLLSKLPSFFCNREKT